MASGNQGTFDNLNQLPFVHIPNAEILSLVFGKSVPATLLFHGCNRFTLFDFFNLYSPNHNASLTKCTQTSTDCTHKVSILIIT